MKLMDDKRVILIKDTWSTAFIDKAALADGLYKMMVIISEDLKPIAKQLRANSEIDHMLETINEIVWSLPDFNSSETAIKGLITLHASKGISNETYESGVIALLMILEKKVKRWTPECREAWIFLFASIHLHFATKLRTEPRLEKLLQRKTNLIS
jgi:hypothetical protein